MSADETSEHARPVLDPDELRARVDDALDLLETIAQRRDLLAEVESDTRTRLLKAAGMVARPGPWAKRELARAMRRKRKRDIRERDEAVLQDTGIRIKRAAPVFETPRFGMPPVLPGDDIDAELANRDTLPSLPHLSTEEDAGKKARTVIEPRVCYVCKTSYREIHDFYDHLCPPCAELNYRKRNQTADLRGRVALVTGGRVKIGYQAAIFLLRAGASVIVTTRFPRDAAQRFAGEEDYAVWGERLSVFGLDLRHTPSVETFARHACDTLDRLDFIINNACQTVRRPAGFYSHLMEAEAQDAKLSEPVARALASYESMRQGAAAVGKSEGALVAMAGAVGLSDPASLSQLALLEEDLNRSTHLFPAGQLDQDLQQVDLRDQNSWRMPLHQVSAVELLEVQLVNAVAPFLLNARLKSLMLRQPSRDKHIVNVSAMEGQFYRSFKTDKHPHTNMAKAALNMMTRTSAADYVQDGIHMNSVDTGWVTDEDPAEIAARKTAMHRFHPPLDIVDGAARIVDPIFDGINTGKHLWGLFLKDYQPTPW